MLQVGTKVEAEFSGDSAGDNWYPGKIIAVNKKYNDVNLWTYDVRYEDNDLQKDLPRKLFRILPTAELPIGTTVDTRSYGELDWFRATVENIDKSGGGPAAWTYDLRYKEGDLFEEKVPRSQIRKSITGKQTDDFTSTGRKPKYIWSENCKRYNRFESLSHELVHGNNYLPCSGILR